MTGTRPFLALLGIAAIVLATLATWSVLHNPTIDGTSRGDDYDCLAPYDTVLNDAGNVPGGEPPVAAAMLAAAAAAVVGLSRPAHR